MSVGAGLLKKKEQSDKASMSRAKAVQPRVETAKRGVAAATAIMPRVGTAKSWLLTASYLRFFFFLSRRRHTRLSCDWSSDVCSSDLDHMFFFQAEDGIRDYRVTGVQTCALVIRDYRVTGVQTCAL